MNYYEQILSALKTKYSYMGLNENVLERTAKNLSENVEKEEQVETSVNGVESYLKMLQSELDKIRNEKSGLQKELDSLRRAEDERKAAEEKQKPMQDKPIPKKDVKAEVSAKAELAKKTTETETPEQVFDRLFAARFAEAAKGYEEKVFHQQEEIERLSNHIKAQDKQRAEAEKLAAYKGIARKMGIAESYSPVIMSFAATSTDAQDFESKVKSFKQSLTDDSAHSATPPETPQQRVEKEGEAIAALIDEGTKQIVEQKK